MAIFYFADLPTQLLPSNIKTIDDKTVELSERQKISFQEKGILYLKSFLPKKFVSPAQKSVLAELDRLDLRGKSKKATKLQSMPFFQQITNLSQMVKTESELDMLFTAELLQVMNELAGSKLKVSMPHPQLLLSLPQKEEWSVNNLNWHLDLAVPTKNEISGIQAFILINDLAPKGGATLAISGSHRLHYLKPGNETAHAVLRNDQIFSGLFNNRNPDDEILLKPHLVHGIEISLTEMSGKAGDVYLMDLRTLHSPSINSSKNIRMMTTNRFIK